jgi:hypothetical protein
MFTRPTKMAPIPVRAIAIYGKSKALFAELEAVEAEIRDLKHQLAQSAPRNNKSISTEGFRTFVYQKAAELKDVLLRDRTLVQQALRALIRKLILTPVTTADGLPDFPYLLIVCSTKWRFGG